MNPTRDLLIDVDGVLYPFPELFHGYAQQQLGRDLPLDLSQWAFYEEWGLQHDDFVRLLSQGVADRDLWWDDAVYAEVPEALVRLRAAGHRLHLVTARGLAGDAPAMAATRHWIAARGFVFDTVNLADDKPSVLDRLGLDPTECVAVDDGEHHVQAWLDHGVAAVVLDRWGAYSGELASVPDLAAFADYANALGHVVR